MSPGDDELGDVWPLSHTGGPETEREAADTVGPTVGQRRQWVLEIVAEHPDGLIAEEVVRYYRQRHGAMTREYSIRPRLTELMDKYGLLEQTGKRANSRGQNEVVWCVCAPIAPGERLSRIQAAVLAERQACAELVDALAARERDLVVAAALRVAAAAIRARS